MKKSFLEFLKEDGRIPSSILVQAEIIRLRSTPYTFELASQGILNPEKMLSVLLCQERDKGTFKAALEAEGLFTLELDKRLREKKRKCQVSLAAVLEQEHLVPNDLLQILLRDFQAQEARRPHFKSAQGRLRDSLLEDILALGTTLVEKLKSAESPKDYDSIRAELRQVFQRAKGLLRFQKNPTETWAAAGEAIFATSASRHLGRKDELLMIAKALLHALSENRAPRENSALLQEELKKWAILPAKFYEAKIA